MSWKIIFSKIRNRIWSIIVKKYRDTFFYNYLYLSYWHYLLNINKNNITNYDIQYLTAIPNQGAGIGHQMANWIAGFWYAKKFNLEFVHSSFSSLHWEEFLGFGEDEIQINALTNYKKVKLPLFRENNDEETNLIKRIIDSYNGKKVVFFCEQDQSYRDQFGVIDHIRQKFYNSDSRKKDNLIFKDNSFNIAIHIRRGDIVIGQENQNPNLQMRFQNNEYFVNVLNHVLKKIKSQKNITIYLFSQSNKEEFQEFEKFKNMNYCLDMNDQDSFLHMVMADVLITSKSSFSYKPALLNKGLKVVPANFWHGYPKAKDWILLDDNGVVI